MQMKQPGCEHENDRNKSRNGIHDDDERRQRGRSWVACRDAWSSQAHTHTEVLLRRTVLDGSELLFVKYETMSNVRSAENLLDG